MQVKACILKSMHINEQETSQSYVKHMPKKLVLFFSFKIILRQ